MLLEYVSFLYTISIYDLFSSSTIALGCTADLRKFCTAGKARLLQRRSIPSNYRRTSTMYLDFFFCLTYCLFQRILWFRVATRLGQVKEVPAYMDKSCTSHAHTSRPLLHRIADINHPHLSIYSSHWQRRRDPSRTTVHRCRNPRNGQLGTKHQRFVSFVRSNHSPMHHCMTH